MEEKRKITPRENLINVLATFDSYRLIIEHSKNENTKIEAVRNIVKSIPKLVNAANRYIGSFEI